MATAAQLRAIRKKHGLGEFRNKKTNSNKFTRRFKMAKKRRSSRRYSRSSGNTNLMGTAVGVGAYILYEAMLEPKVAAVIGNGLVLNVAELAAGAYLARKGGVLGNVGKAAVVINTYQILQPLLQNISA